MSYSNYNHPPYNANDNPRSHEHSRHGYYQQHPNYTDHHHYHQHQHHNGMLHPNRPPVNNMAGGHHHPPPPPPPPPIPPQGNHHPYHRSNTTINRSKSLTRPERQRPRQGLIHHNQQPQEDGAPSHPGLNHRRPPASYNNPHPRENYNYNQQPMSDNLQAQLAQQKKQLNMPSSVSTDSSSSVLEPSHKNPKKEKEPPVLTNWWAWVAFLCTCCIPNIIIRKWFGKTNKGMQQAWREKVTLCYLVLFLCAILAYVTYGLHFNLCPANNRYSPYSALDEHGQRQPLPRKDVTVFGRFYDFKTMQHYLQKQSVDLTDDFKGVELGPLFDIDTNNNCAAYPDAKPPCSVKNADGKKLQKPDGSCLSYKQLNKKLKSDHYLSFDWQDVRSNDQSMANSNLAVVVNTIVDLSSYFDTNKPIFGDSVDRAIRQTRGNDLTYALLYTSEGKKARACIESRYGVGTASQEDGSCIANNIIMTVMFVVIIIIIIIRYSMALLFQWFISRRLTKPGGRSNWLAWRSIKGGNDDPANHIPGPYNNYGPLLHGSVNSLNSAALQHNHHHHHPHHSNSHSFSNSVRTNSTGPRAAGDQVALNGVQTDIVDTELYTVMLVTCYSEGEEGLRTTMDSLSNTTYSNKHKIFFVIADGLITGAGESRSTPDIVVDMMDLSPAMANPKACSYLAVADGEKQLNMAKVYAGHYNNTPCITIVKCGTEEEQKGPKPGNRGKRDSQVILMSFFQRVIFNDRLCELDYEIFWKMTWLMKGVTPDKFELVLMVDADTQVLPDALTYMVAAMANDITIMGLCGETRIANKRASWVSAIQVFEYYISHHYAKAYESLFGMVTCLPGCFSMYRIKTPKHGSWVPILASPDIIMDYNQNVVNTLHEKNLLLLGEDRFLSTLMLRNFPKRQMMFVPQARCRTIVPDEFKVLLSQRRRWINSTVHNLMELVLVSDLCGISFLSMQFSVFIDLIGTFVLPAAIVMTVYLIVSSAVSGHPEWQSIGLLIAILFLPAILIAMTTFKFIYVLWLLVYLIALPVWNLILPIYSFWHFDDFSWGATRMVEGEKKGDSHGDASGKFDSKKLIMKKWEDWEAERTGGLRQDRKFPLKTPEDSLVQYDANYSPKSPYSTTRNKYL
ncbi:chitin synthase-domain-containing protein [Mycotypha africana]|uniref:chitin synthase-domain-containing protein n=1 Tax=Mycotypha africana TaxID=64632 RepID=UPI002300C81F|nr:chitin synthase-domain-containing protein [Mycotypha africana]KAI8969288.1 chitin synthase-domain-containing protein [Mycotypha africana]